ncbi:MAG TPA: DUF3617 domain-containing protein [Acidobacteriaceae bacterium]|jgi:hypothetical protein
MKILFVPLAVLPLLCVVAAAQEPIPNIAPPPVKMGLWQSTINVKPGMGPAGAAVTNQSCYTPDSWKQSMQSIQSRQPNTNCSTSNLHQDAHQLSFDVTCAADQGYTISYHVEMFLDSDTAMHGSTTGKMSGPAFPQGMTMGSTITSKFLSSDCGSIKPGESKPVHP